jgi:hypothetical protein
MGDVWSWNTFYLDIKYVTLLLPGELSWSFSAVDMFNT